MAISFVSQNTANAISVAGSTGITFTKPSGTQDNDLLVVGIYETDISPVTPSGWTQLIASTPRTGERLVVYYKIASSEPSSIGPFTSSASSMSFVGFISCYRGVNTSTPIDVTASAGTAVTSGTTVTAPSVTTVTNNAWMLTVYGLRKSSNFSTPTGMTERVDYSDGLVATVALDDQLFATAGATGTKSSTTGATINFAQGISFGIKPQVTTTITPAAGSISSSLKTPSLKSTIKPGAGSLALTGKAPVLKLVIKPAAGSLALTGQTPAIKSTVKPAAGSLTLTGQTPKVVSGIKPAAGSMTLTGQTPRATSKIQPAAGSLTLTGHAPALTFKLVTPAGTAPLYATGTLTYTNKPQQGDTVTIDGVTYTYVNNVTNSGNQIHIGATAALSAQNLAYALSQTGTPGTDYSNTVVLNPQVSLDTYTASTVIVQARVPGTVGNSISTTVSSTRMSWGASTLTGGANGVGYMVAAPLVPVLIETITTVIAPAGGSLTLTGHTPTETSKVNVAAGSLTLTGHAPVLNLVDRPSAGSLTLTGNTPSLNITRTITPAAGSIAVTFNTPHLVFKVVPGAGSLTLTGETPTINIVIGIVVPSGSMTLAGNTPVLKSVIAPSAGSMTLTGQTPTVKKIQTIAPAAGSMTTTGHAPVLARVIRPAAGSMVVTFGTPSIVSKVRPGAGAMVLTGQQAGFAGAVTSTETSTRVTLGYASSTAVISESSTGVALRNRSTRAAITEEVI